MSKLDDLTIGEVKTIQGLLSGSQQTKQLHGLQIVILDRGFVYIGLVSTDNEWVYIENAKNIRAWGTTKGLGELSNGPTSKTVLDPTGNVKAARGALIGMVSVEESQWNGKF